jgi:hypothetical protein
MQDPNIEELSPYMQMVMRQNAARDAAKNKQNSILGEITGIGKVPKHKRFTTSRRVDEFIGKNRIITSNKYTDEELKTMREALIYGSKTEGHASLKALAERETTNNLERILRGGVASRNSALNNFLDMSEIGRSVKPEGISEALFKLSAVNMSKQITEATGYLYHFAPSEARESIAKSGFQSVTDDRH